LVKELVDENSSIIESLGKKAVGPILKLAKDHSRLKWADGKSVKDALDKLLLERGSLSDDKPKASKPKKEKPSEPQKQASSEDLYLDASKDPFFLQGDLAKLHKPGGNKQIKPELMEQHLRETGGIVMTRFPPEPNGICHTVNI
jgi:glutaminyl-tRNA synthetase